MVPRTYSHLTEADRLLVQVHLSQGESQNSIAKRIGCWPSTISRELARARAHTGHLDRYFAFEGQLVHDLNRKSAGQARRKLCSSFDSPAARAVVKALHQGWSPQQICGRFDDLNAVRPGSRPTLCHETIYAAIYAQPRGGLRTELVKALRKSRAGRLPRARGKGRCHAIQEAVSISLRPPVVAARIVPGHWEGDLIKGARNASAVGTLVERVSRRVMLVRLDKMDAQSVCDAFTGRLRRIPISMRKTLTYDRGSEMSMHKELARRLHIDIFFCDPYMPSQRGTNENTNGLIREYLPKGTDLSNLTDQQLRFIENRLNNRPRKILSFKTPNEVFAQLSRDQISGVALQG